MKTSTYEKIKATVKVRRFGHQTPAGVEWYRIGDLSGWAWYGSDFQAELIAYGKDAKLNGCVNLGYPLGGAAELQANAEGTGAEYRETELHWHSPRQSAMAQAVDNA